MSVQGGVERPDVWQAGSGGGLLVVLMDVSVATSALECAATWASTGCTPLSVLARVRRPPFAPGLPFAPIGHYWTDDELVADARRELTTALRPLALFGRVELTLALGPIEATMRQMLRERDYTCVVVGSGHRRLQRRQRRRVVSVASAYCPALVVD